MRILAAILSLIVALPASALPPCERVSAVATPGDVTCTGLLWPRAASEQAARCIAADLPQARASVRACAIAREADLREAQATRRLERQACAARAERLLADLHRAEDLALNPPAPPWHDSPWLWGAGGVILGAMAGWSVHAIAR